MKTAAGEVEHWTDYPTKLKMSTLERIYRAYLRQQGLKDTGTKNEVRLWLAKEFGKYRTVKTVSFI